MAIQTDDDDNKSRTVKRFASMESMSVSQYYKLASQGLGPEFYYNGNTRRITPEAHRQWREKMVARAKAERGGGAR